MSDTIQENLNKLMGVFTMHLDGTAHTFNASADGQEYICQCGVVICREAAKRITFAERYGGVVNLNDTHK